MPSTTPGRLRLQEDGSQRTTEFGEVRIQEPTADDQTLRLVSLFPQPWASSAALQSGGLLYSLLNGIASAITLPLTQGLAYAQRQTRVGSATDSNLDQASKDFFGIVLPRIPFEPDASFSYRIRRFTVAPRTTQPGITNCLTDLFSGWAAAQANPSVQNIAALGLGGPLGLSGGLGVTAPQPIVPFAIPTVYCFDKQRDAALSQVFNIAPPQFGILLTFPVSRYSLWFANRSYANRTTYAGTTGGVIVADPTIYVWGPYLVRIVNAMQAPGTVPVYIVKRTIV